MANYVAFATLSNEQLAAFLEQTNLTVNQRTAAKAELLKREVDALLSRRKTYAQISMPKDISQRRAVEMIQMAEYLLRRIGMKKLVIKTDGFSNDRTELMRQMQYAPRKTEGVYANC